MLKVASRCDLKCDYCYVHEHALPLARTSAGVLRDTLGPAHPSTMAADNNLALLLIENGQRDAGHDVLADVVQRLAVALGDNHPDTYVSGANLAIAEKGDHVAVVDRLAERVGPGHPVVRALQRRHRVRRVLDPHTY
ncbi:hypothetical protein [Actinoplanes sp. NPDC020271]|uniref:hypothetical protein n=1 Tax=Actinoplanes sp. NPDC020271 TaxID=3363896 RepID=UPI00379DD0DF